jgi:NADH dehydrogenase
MASERKQITILGAGYGGLRTALRLKQLLQNEDWQILLIDRYYFHQLKTELHEVAAARLNANVILVPLKKLIKNKNINFLQAEATDLNFVQHLITTSKGKVKYDKLVIALGSETEFFGIPGLVAQAFTLTSIEDATHISAHIQETFKQAKTERDIAKRQAALTFVIGGGGYTGVELATELIDHVMKLCRKFEIPQKEPQVIVVEASDRVLSGFDAELSDHAKRVMKTKGIKLMLKKPCVSVEDDVITLKTGERIPTHTLIWTGGVRACELIEQTESKHGLRYGARGRVVVNQYLESVDHPDVYVIGDNALITDPVTNRPLAPSAQLALQEADVAALNIAAEIKGFKRVRYVPKVAGEFVSLGGGNAVGWVWKFKVTGFLAWFLKRLSVARYLYSLGGFKLVIPKLRALFFS